MAHAKYSRARSAQLQSIPPENLVLIADAQRRIAQILALNADIDALPDNIVRYAKRRHALVRTTNEPFYIVGTMYYGHLPVGLDRHGRLWSLRPDKPVTPLILEEMPHGMLERLQAHLISLFLKVRHRS